VTRSYPGLSPQMCGSSSTACQSAKPAHAGKSQGLVRSYLASIGLR